MSTKREAGRGKGRKGRKDEERKGGQEIGLRWYAAADESFNEGSMDGERYDGGEEHAFRGVFARSKRPARRPTRRVCESLRNPHLVELELGVDGKLLGGRHPRNPLALVTLLGHKYVVVHLTFGSWTCAL